LSPSLRVGIVDRLRQRQRCEAQRCHSGDLHLVEKLGGIVGMKPNL
jgi:hypothetical protein